MKNKMYKLLQKYNIKTIFRSSYTFALIFILIISIVGFINTKRVNSKLEAMFNESTLPISEVQNIRTDLVSTKTFIEQLSKKYDSSTVNLLNKFMARINKNLQLLDDGKLEDSTLKESINKYQSDINTIISKAKKNETISQSEIDQIYKTNEKIDENLKELTESFLKIAEQFKKDGEIIYSNSVKNYAILVVIVFIFGYTMALLVRKIIDHTSKEILDNMKLIADGDFTVELNTKHSTEFGLISRELQSTINSIASMLKQIKENAVVITDESSSLSAIAEEMSASTEQVASSITEVAQGATSQAQELIKTSETVKSFGDKMDNILKSIEAVDNSATEANNRAVISNKDLENLAYSINEISTAFNDVSHKINSLGKNINQINDITSIIKGIANQTNLLSLNAMIESARAGEAGRGFAVVADEIRKLAEQSKESSDNISNLVSVISGEANTVVINTNSVNDKLEGQLGVIEKSMNSFKDIIKSINLMLPQIKNITEQAIVINEDKTYITESIAVSSAVSEENCASAEEISATSQEMSSSSQEVANAAQSLTTIADEMMNQVDKFKL